MQGSPPQVRGKRIGALAGMEQNRITPAGAGKTNVPAGFLCSVVGSPPQVRGKPRARFLLSSRSGITPAGAGKTTVSRAISHGQRDHPRRCGENKPLHLGLFGQQGSPPQVRGKPIAAMIALACYRITPAGAGKTKSRHNNSVYKTDHPRRCGENYRYMFLRW